MSRTHQQPSVPCIDLQDSEPKLLDALDHALTTTGFVLVDGHGIPADLTRALRQLMIYYFSRSTAAKQAEAITPDNYRGYIPLGFFTANSRGRTPDHYEGYKLHQEIPPEAPICQQCGLYGPNRWPAEPPGLRDVVLDYWQHCDQVSRRLLAMLAAILEIDTVQFLSLFDQPLTNMTLLHYPAQEPSAEGFGIHPHKDTDALTLLFPDPIGGLWLRPREQRDWLEINAPEQTLIVNIGDLLELWSGGRFVSTPHKVVNRSGAPRYTFPYFVVPRHDVVVSSLVSPQPGFQRGPVQVGDVSQEVWRTNWPDAQPSTQGFDLGTLSDN